MAKRITLSTYASHYNNRNLDKEALRFSVPVEWLENILLSDFDGVDIEEFLDTYTYDDGANIKAQAQADNVFKYAAVKF